MIPPYRFPEGKLQLFQMSGSEKTLICELTTSSKNREKIQRIRNDMLLIDPTLTLVVSENNALR